MIIEAEGLAKTFRRHDAVRHVSLTVPKGAVYALVGENGAGKTTDETGKVTHLVLRNNGREAGRARKMD